MDEEGRTYQRFPVARFRCRRRGPDQPRDVTFSVLPAQVVPRRRFSLGLMSWMVEVVVNGKRTMRQALDEVATAGSQGEEAVLLEELTLHRMLLLLAAVYGRALFSGGRGRVARSRPRGAAAGPAGGRAAGGPAPRLSTPSGAAFSSALLPPPAVRPTIGSRAPLWLADGLTHRHPLCLQHKSLNPLFAPRCLDPAGSRVMTRIDPPHCVIGAQR